MGSIHISHKVVRQHISFKVVRYITASSATVKDY